MSSTAINTDEQSAELANYYRFHSKFYDISRWLFLFGHKHLIRRLPSFKHSPNILEVGCGTGKILYDLSSKYPHSEITGIDISEEMLAIAEKKIHQHKLQHHINLCRREYGTGEITSRKYDLIIFSYSLTMMGEHKSHILKTAYRELKPEGLIAVIDFNRTPFRWFEKWMKLNHVDLDGSALELLNHFFSPELLISRNAFGGWWNYFSFIGIKQSKMVTNLNWP